MSVTRVVATCVGLAMPIAISAQGSPVTSVATAERGVAQGHIRGVVYDSLQRKPAAGALVWLATGAASTKTDRNGRFELSNVAAGTQSVMFAMPVLDSMGVGTLGREVLVKPENVSTLALGTPSFSTLWRFLCGGATLAGTDSGIVWGSVRDAGSDIRQGGALTKLSWYEGRVGADKKFVFSETQAESRTDTTGTYYACGVPTEVRLSVQALGAKAASGMLELQIGESRIRRLDLLVSTDMVESRTDSAPALGDTLPPPLPSGRALLRGVIRDDKGNPLGGAILTVASIDTIVRANANGEFRIAALPAGTHLVQARHVGFAPVMTIVDLRPDSTTVAPLDLPATTTLATFNVRAERVAGLDRVNFELRKKRGFGFAFEASQFQNYTDVNVILKGLPNITVTGDNVVAQVGIQLCRLTLYLDGVRSDMAQIRALPLSHFRAVEVYPRGMSAPMPYGGATACGVVLYTTKNARW